LLLALPAAVLLDLSLRRLWLDDPWISFRYAANLASGHGLVFNPGERVEGFSNPSWTLLLALVIAVHLPALAMAKLFGIALHVLTLVLLWRLLSRRTGSDAGVSGVEGPGWTDRLAAAVALLIVTSSSWVALWAVAGLETPLYVAALVAAVAASASGRPRLAAALLLLAALTRIEGILAGLAFLALLARRPSELRQNLAVPGILLGGFALSMLARLVYYGHLLPNSYVDKSGLPLGQAWHGGLSYLHGSLIRVGGSTNWMATVLPAGEGFSDAVKVCLLVSAAGLLTAWWRVRGPLAVAVTLAAAVAETSLVIALFSGGDWMPGGRFLVPVLVLGAIPLGYGAGKAARWMAGAGRLVALRAAAAAAALVLAVPALVIWTAGQHHDVANYLARFDQPAQRAPRTALDPSGVLGSFSSRNPRYEALARWLDANAAPGSLVAIEEAGLVPYLTPQLRYLDLFGLTDPVIARGTGRPPFDKHDNTYVLDRRPSLVVTWGQPLGQGFRSAHQRTLLADPRFRAHYRQVLLAPKDALFSFAVYARLDGPRVPPTS
jgi:arabinofuranosyltransferase